jgi:long-chain fatty acid transport protein
MQRTTYSGLATALITLLISTPLWATNGYFTHGIGTKNKGMVGAGLAMPEDAMSIANNPAAALANAGKYDLGVALFSPHRSYETSSSVSMGQGGAFTIGPNKLDSDNELFFIPHMAGSWKIDDKSAWAAAFYGRGGMNTEWNGGDATFDPDGPPPFGGPYPVMTLPGTFGGGISGNMGAAGVDFSQAMLDIAYARSVGDNFTLGVSAIIVAQVFAARGLHAFAGFTETFAASGGTVMPGNLTNNSHDEAFGIGGKFGFQWDVNEQVSFAAAYQTEISMSKLDDYSDLFADGGNMDVPADLKVGLTFRPNPRLALNFDVEKTWYNDVPSVGNPFSNLYACPTAGAGGSDVSSCLGGRNGAGFGWENMTTYKVGVQWDADNNWIWRAGFSHGDQPIPESEVVFNILAPGVMEDHLTFGFTNKLRSGNEFSVAVMYAFNKKVSGPNPLDYPDPSIAQTISFDMDEWELEFSYGWR